MKRIIFTHQKIKKYIAKPHFRVFIASFFVCLLLFFIISKQSGSNIPQRIQDAFDPIISTTNLGEMDIKTEAPVNGIFGNIFSNIKEYSVNVVNTICSATSERQDEAVRIASKADCMIVIGGASSSNSRKLYEICCGLCDNTVFVQTLEDLVSQNFSLSRSSACVGITAGASTPNNIIEEVQRYVRGIDI